MIEMQTLMHQISAILNSRPLTAVRTAPEDVEALNTGALLDRTPAMLRNDDAEPIHTRWKRVQWLTKQFWTRWRSEYLAQLRCAAKWTRRMPNVREGQIVLLGDDNIPLSRWPLGIVIRRPRPGRGYTSRRREDRQWHLPAERPSASTPAYRSCGACYVRRPGLP
uniref:DUF5641 domain-containing protein n=1 Tax=Anopheles albimanus TaxID=7167 RepID=A0A182FND8_ANOAL